jgi:hypothetical protein
MGRTVAARIGKLSASEPAAVARVRGAVLSSLSQPGSRRGRARLRLAGSLLAAVLFASCSTQSSRPRPLPAPQHTLTLGLCEDYPEESRSLQGARADLQAAHEAGARVLRIAFGWDAMEPERGKFDWSFWDEYVKAATEDYGLTLIPYICYTPKWAATDPGENYWRSPPRDPQDFARFVAAAVGRYRDRIHSWELWNEPDNAAYWLGRPEQFAALVRAGSAAVRTADPSAKIVLGGIAGELDFLAKVLHDGQTAASVDVVNIHSYFETWHPSPIEHVTQYVAGAAGLIRDTGGHQPLWMAETGYSSVGERAEVSSVYRAHFRGEHTEAAQANALARTVFAVAATEQVTLLAWYRINDLVSTQEVIGDDNNRHLGLRDAAGGPKPALAAFRYAASLFSAPYDALPVRVTATAAGASEPPVLHAFAFPDGRVVLAAWLGMPEQPAGRAAASDLRRAECTVSLPRRLRRVEVRNALGQRLNAPAPLEPRGESTALHVSLRGGDVRVFELR